MRSRLVRSGPLYLSALQFQFSQRKLRRAPQAAGTVGLRGVLAALTALALTGCAANGVTPSVTQAQSAKAGQPTVSSVNPASGVSGTSVTIKGKGFSATATVAFGVVNATTAFVSSTELTTSVPSLSAGTYTVTVTNPDSAPAASPSGFTVTSKTTAAAAATTNHYLYAVTAGPVVTVYDMDSGFKQIKQVSAGTSKEEIRGAVASKVGGFLYISYGCTSPVACTPYLMKYDLSNDSAVWNNVFHPGVDSHAITPDGKTIYMPTGEGDALHSLWYKVDTSNGSILGTIESGVLRPHNTIVSNDGSHLYLGAIGLDTNGDGENHLIRVDTSDAKVSAQVGPVLNGKTRPFTIDGREQYAFITTAGLNGFEVGSISTGDILFTVKASGFDNIKCTPFVSCSHGISLSPDSKQIYVVDYYNNYVHVFDVSGLPSSAPSRVADIPLKHPYTAPGPWVTHSRDGKFVFVGQSGDVIDTGTHKIVGYLPALSHTKVYTEIDFQNGDVSFTPLSRSGVGYN